VLIQAPSPWSLSRRRPRWGDEHAGGAGRERLRHRQLIEIAGIVVVDRNTKTTPRRSRTPLSQRTNLGRSGRGFRPESTAEKSGQQPRRSSITPVRGMALSSSSHVAHADTLPGRAPVAAILRSPRIATRAREELVGRFRRRASSRLNGSGDGVSSRAGVRRAGGTCCSRGRDACYDSSMSKDEIMKSAEARFARQGNVSTRLRWRSRGPHIRSHAPPR